MQLFCKRANVVPDAYANLTNGRLRPFCERNLDKGRGSAYMSPMETFNVRTMLYDTIRTQLGRSVPFARHAGVEIDAIGKGHASAHLPFRPEGLNHIGTQHAAALFALGETASGAAMAGAFAPILFEVRPVAAEATIRYLGPAKGSVSAEARVDGEPDALLSTVKTEGKVRFPVVVSLKNEDGAEIGEMQVNWHVSRGRA